MSFHGAFGNAQGFGYLAVTQPDEESQLDYIGLGRVFLRKLIEIFMDGQQPLIVLGRSDFNLIEVNALLSTAMADALPPPRFLDKDAAHRFSSGAKEVRATIPGTGFSATREPQPRFVDERGGLQSLSRPLVSHLGCGETAKFAINQGQQLFSGSRITRLGRLEDSCDIAHAGSLERRALAATSNHQGKVIIR
jgi:hypothetical protein